MLHNIPNSGHKIKKQVTTKQVSFTNSSQPKRAEYLWIFAHLLSNKDSPQTLCTSLSSSLYEGRDGDCGTE